MFQNLRLKSAHGSGAVQGLIVPQYKLYSIASVILTSNTATLNFIIEGFSSCLSERCLIKIFFS